MQHSRRICSTGNWLVAFCQRFWETYEGNANKTDLPSSGSVFRISKIGALPCKRCASTTFSFRTTTARRNEEYLMFHIELKNDCP